MSDYSHTFDDEPDFVPAVHWDELNVGESAPYEPLNLDIDPEWLNTLAADFDELQLNFDAEVLPSVDEEMQFFAPTDAQDAQQTLLFTFHEDEYGEVSLVPVDGVDENALVLYDSAPVIFLPAPEQSLQHADEMSLYDARFIGHSVGSQDGQVSGYTLQAIQVYQDTNAEFTAHVLDVGHYDSMKEAEGHYFALQGKVDNGIIPAHYVGAVATGRAIENGMEPQWRDASRDEVERYVQHLYAPEVSGRRIEPGFGRDSEEYARIFHNERADLSEQQRAVDALISAGLQPPENFNLERDSFHDESTGQRFIAGVFKADPENDRSGCQAAFIALEQDADGLGLHADATPIGVTGSLDAARENWERVHTSLYREGVDGAVRTMESIQQDHVIRQTRETLAKEEVVDQPQFSSPRGLDIGM
jgi:hypothetical protein